MRRLYAIVSGLLVLFGGFLLGAGLLALWEPGAAVGSAVLVGEGTAFFLGGFLGLGILLKR